MRILFVLPLFLLYAIFVFSEILASKRGEKPLRISRIILPIPLFCLLLMQCLTVNYTQLTAQLRLTPRVLPMIGAFFSQLLLGQGAQDPETCLAGITGLGYVIFFSLVAFLIVRTVENLRSKKR